jgi:phosphopantothenoylcysteine decarboxylase/phosphopantothenate/cysteine ligase
MVLRWRGCCEALGWTRSMRRERAHGVAKAWRKGADLLAVNAVGPAFGFGDVPNAVVVLDAQGREVARASGSRT